MSVVILYQPHYTLTTVHALISPSAIQRTRLHGLPPYTHVRAYTDASAAYRCATFTHYQHVLLPHPKTSGILQVAQRPHTFVKFP
jgi:hypothetical protein